VLIPEVVFYNCAGISDMSPKKRSGRRNIRKIIDDVQVSQETQNAEKMEIERRKRLEEQDDLEEEVLTIC